MAPDLVYRGSPKHKNRPATGRKGTLCPEWSHTAGAVRLQNDMEAHVWSATAARNLLAESELDPLGSRKRYATRSGVAFAGHDTKDGTWHGYPVPWNDVPSELKDRWRAEGRVTRKDLRRYSDRLDTDIEWALESDDE